MLCFILDKIIFTSIKGKGLLWLCDLNVFCGFVVAGCGGFACLFVHIGPYRYSISVDTTYTVFYSYSHKENWCVFKIGVLMKHSEQKPWCLWHIVLWITIYITAYFVCTIFWSLIQFSVSSKEILQEGKKKLLGRKPFWIIISGIISPRYV